MASVQIQAVLYGNEPENLLRSLDSLRQSALVSREKKGLLTDFTVVYGDASPKRVFDDEEVARLTAEYADGFVFRYLPFGENTGSAKGHNRLGAECGADFMQIQNPDVIVSPLHFIRMAEALDGKNVGMVEARQTPIEHPKEYDCVTMETPWATTACAIFPTSVFRALNGFDSDTFFLYCDDLDFSWRVRLLGKRVVYQPLSPVYHAKRLNTDGSWKPTSAEVYYSAEAALFMAYKWSNPLLCKRLLLQFRASGSEAHIRAVEEFKRREKAGTLPQPLDREHRVATFVGDGYAEHRFTL